MTDNRDALVGRELLPCPFCGGEARRITIDENEPNNAGGDAIVCVRCHASSHVEFGRKENLVSRWNMRAALATQVQPAAPVLTETGVGFKVGETLASLRNAAGMTLRDVERAVEGRFSNALLSQMETGKVKRPSATVMLDLARVYGVPFYRVADAAGVNPAYAGDELGDGFATLAQPLAAAEAVEREGWVLVPRVPTPDMYLAAVTAWQGALSDYWTQEMWDAMIAAAPASGGSHE